MTDAAFIVSSGRGVHEAIAAARVCAQSGTDVAVVDMPSIDEDLLLQLSASGKVVCLAEQNNGYILQNLLKVQHHRARRVRRPSVHRDQHARPRREAAVHPLRNV